MKYDKYTKEFKNIGDFRQTEEVQNSKSSREITNYLKGLAILAVYFSHFANNYVLGFSTEYGNGFVSIFFILSGFGIYASLNKKSNFQHVNFILDFFRKRITRIYPLLWIKYLVFGFSGSLLTFFALDFINPKSYWFIPGIIQCYIVTPVLFLYFRKINTKKSILVLVISFALLNFPLFIFVGEPVRIIGYRGLFFQHIFLFLLGFILAKIYSSQAIPRVSKFVSLLSFFFYLFCIHETSALASFTFPSKDLLFSCLFSLSTFLVCYAFLLGKIYLPLKHLLQIMGKYSYSVYLFHSVGFALLLKIGLFTEEPEAIFSEAVLINIVTLLVFTPIFLCLYSILEIIVNELIFGKKEIKTIKIKTLEVINSFKNPF